MLVRSVAGPRFRVMDLRIKALDNQLRAGEPEQGINARSGQRQSGGHKACSVHLW